VQEGDRIRKVVGASVLSIWQMLSGEFIRLVLLAVAKATPVAFYFGDEWLQQYDYCIDIPWWVFAGALALLITLLTISYESHKAASANPVRTLRNRIDRRKRAVDQGEVVQKPAPFTILLLLLSGCLKSIRIFYF